MTLMLKLDLMYLENEVLSFSKSKATAWPTDLESRPATTPRFIARSSILKPIFGKKLLQLEDFALQ